jgi:RNA polymerase sigma factor (sigma-70 family)
MVWGVVRRVAGNGPDAEDAFQATFLVLVRKAGSLRSRELVGNWLYGVAYRTALKARTAAARRRARERQVERMPHPEVGPDEAWSDLQPVLDRELERLPDKYRVPLVLCELEGRSRKEVARQLRLPEGTLSSRLATARRMLAARLTRRGLTLSAATLAAALSQQAASAGVPRELVVSTVRVATRAAGALPAGVSALTEGMVKSMLIRKLKIGTVGLLALGVAALAAGGAARKALARPDESVPGAKKATNAKAPAVADASHWPSRPMPVPVLANIDKDGSVITRHIVTAMNVRRVIGADGEERVFTEPVVIPQIRRGEKDVVKMFDTKGRRVEPKDWARLLKKPVLALAYLNGETPDPQHLRLIKEGTLILVLPPPPPPAAPAVPPVPAVPAAPLPRPADLPPAPSTPIPGGPVPPPAPSTPIPPGYSAPPTTPALPPRNP